MSSIKDNTTVNAEQDLALCQRCRRPTDRWTAPGYSGRWPWCWPCTLRALTPAGWREWWRPAPTRRGRFAVWRRERSYCG